MIWKDFLGFWVKGNVSRIMQIMRKALKYPITISIKFAELGIVSVFSAMSVFMIAITRIPLLKFS